MAKLFVDFEFTGKKRATTPVSLGAVTEDGESQFYAEFTDFDESQVDAWLAEHVLRLRTLQGKAEGYRRTTGGLTELKGTVPFVVASPGGLADWIEGLGDGELTFASFGLSYDHVLFIDLFLMADVELPAFLRRYTFCVSTMLQVYGFDPNVVGLKEQFANQSDTQKHNALFDAHVARSIYLKLSRQKPWASR